jgi:hypothetical protein
MAYQHKQNKNRHFQTAYEPGEGIADKMCRNVCIFYLLLTLDFLSWQLFDTWISRYFLLRQIGYGLQSQTTLRLIAFTVIAGALGGVVDSWRCRSRFTLSFHSDLVALLSQLSGTTERAPWETLSPTKLPEWIAR